MSRLREDPEAQSRVAELARDSYGRLLAALAAPRRDIAAAEDALADALERALARWPDEGIPANPEGWILTVARNRLRDLWKSSAYRMTAPLTETDDSPTEFDDMPAIPDRRLELMLVCAHPAIAPNIRTPLMLQAVLGVDAAAIAEAFAVEPATMAQRLVRAKKRIRDAGIPFALPAREDLAERLPAVLEAVYGAYAIDWQLAPQGAPIESLSAEALHLALALADLLPDEPEVLGLAALVCLSEARRPARRTADGRFIPLDEQDTTLWDEVLIARGESLLRRAHEFGRPGRFQYEAAIQSAHGSRATQGRMDAEALRKLHRAVLRIAPSLGAAVALAAVDGEIECDRTDRRLRRLRQRRRRYDRDCQATSQPFVRGLLDEARSSRSLTIDPHAAAAVAAETFGRTWPRLRLVIDVPSGQPLISADGAQPVMVTGDFTRERVRSVLYRAYRVESFVGGIARYDTLDAAVRPN